VAGTELKELPALMVVMVVQAVQTVEMPEITRILALELQGKVMLVVTQVQTRVLVVEAVAVLAVLDTKVMLMTVTPLKALQQHRKVA